MHKIHLSAGLLYFLQKVLTYHALYQTGPGVSINCEQLMTKKHPEDQGLRGGIQLEKIVSSTISRKLWMASRSVW